MANDKPANKTLSENESKFLSALEKYAQQQKNELLCETEQFEKDMLEKAEEEGIRDAYKLIHSEQDAMRLAISADMAKKEADGNLAIFKRRQEITKEIFARAVTKLQEYTKTSDYEKKLVTDAQQCAEFLEDAPVELCLSKSDMKFSDKLTKIFKGTCTAKEVEDIKLGGFRAYCPSKEISIDKTLDTKLELQKDWFYANSTLQIK